MKYLIVLMMWMTSAWAIETSGEFIRLVPPSIASSAAFIKLKNTQGKPVSLLRAESDIAESVELHTHLKENGMMVMREVKEIVIPAKGSVELKPGGFHIMLIHLKRNLVEKEKIKLTLHFSDKSKKVLMVPVIDDL